MVLPQLMETIEEERAIRKALEREEEKEQMKYREAFEKIRDLEEEFEEKLAEKIGSREGTKVDILEELSSFARKKGLTTAETALLSCMLYDKKKKEKLVEIV